MSFVCFLASVSSLVIVFFFSFASFARLML